jgi:hypothetical protein
MPTLRIAVTITLCITLVGCSEKPQSIVFDISGKESNRSYSFFPIVEENGKLVLGSATAKIADASGYQDWEISARYPQNRADSRNVGIRGRVVGGRKLFGGRALRLVRL